MTSAAHRTLLSLGSCCCRFDVHRRGDARLGMAICTCFLGLGCTLLLGGRRGLRSSPLKRVLELAVGKGACRLFRRLPLHFQQASVSGLCFWALTKGLEGQQHGDGSTRKRPSERNARSLPHPVPDCDQAVRVRAGKSVHFRALQDRSG